MGSLNKVMLLGHLGRDMELKYIPSGQAVGTLNLATTKTWRDKGGQKQEQTEWHRIVVWGDTAEKLAEFLTKGKQILVEGSIHTRQWEDKDGNKRYSTEIKSQRITLLGGGGGAGAGSRRAPAEPHDPVGDPPGAEPLTDDDIPF